MNEIAMPCSRRRRPPSKKLLLAIAWLVFDLAALGFSAFLVGKGHGNDPWVLIGGIAALALIPPEWWTIKRELDRWRNG